MCNWLSCLQAARADQLPHPPLVWRPPLVVDESMVAAYATRVRDYSDCRHTRFSPSSPEHRGTLERLDMHEVTASARGYVLLAFYLIFVGNAHMLATV